MTYEQKRVKKFMQMFGQETPNKPTQIDEQTAKLRAALILEEAIETIVNGLGLTIRLQDDKDGEWNTEISKNSWSKKWVEISFIKEREVDLVEVADGIADLTVVSLGTSVACGIDQNPINEEVFNSNDSKMWVEADLKQLPENCMVEKVREGVYRVKREDGKIIKSPSYKSAQIIPLIQKQINALSE